MKRKRVNESREIFIKLLRSEFGVPSSGSIIKYSDIDKVLGFSRSGSLKPKWYSVVGSWKKELKTMHNIVTKNIINVGIEVLDGPKRINQAGSKYTTGLKRIGECYDISSNTSISDLSKEEKQKRDHLVMSSGRIIMMAEKMENKIKAPDRQIRNVLSPLTASI